MVATAALLAALAPPQASAASYDTVIVNGRVMDPGTGLDAVRNVGISNGRIAAISSKRLTGRRTIDAHGLVVAPGFIDLHSHAMDPLANVYQAHDGVTTSLELEIGVYPIGKWYEALAGKMVINYGATVSHMVARAAPVIGIELLQQSLDPIGAGLVKLETALKIGTMTLAPAQNQEMALALQRGIDQGALGIGVHLSSSSGADKLEIYRAFEVAARSGLTIFVHSRAASTMTPDGIVALQELLANSAATGARLHVVHIGSSGQRLAPLMIEMIDAARKHGLPVTTEVYPYRAAMADFGSPVFRGDWQELMGISYGDIESVKTHQRLTEESFNRGRAETPDEPVVAYVTSQSTVDYAVAHESVIIASDAVDVGRHPRTAGTFSRVLGQHVRERHALSLMQALAKMTIMPARVLEPSVPQMRHKGRIAVGADADIAIFNPDTILDVATFEKPAEFSQGVMHVLVGGVAVIDNGRTVDNVFPGQPVRRPVTH